MKSRSLYFLEPRRVSVQDGDISGPGPGQVLIKSLVSAVSAGTELLVYRGEAPAEMAVDASIPALAGTFSFPLKYGYAVVGQVEARGAGANLREGTLVFAFHPHESLFVARPEELLPVPAGIAPEDAVFLANMETAVTLTLDGAPLLGEQVAIFGQGVVGLLLTALLARFPLASLVTLDRFPRRRLWSETFGAQASLDPASPQAMAQVLAFLQKESFYSGADLTFEVSGSPAALDLAVAVTGFHGRVVIGSWYGRKPVELHLGGEFHRRRQRLISSQVSTIDPKLRGRFSKARCLELAWQMIREIKPACLITHRYPLEEAARAYELLDCRPEEAVQVILTYD